MTMLKSLREQLKKLGETKLEVYAKGTYPNKYGTKVQHVAVYQNDGTKTIKASKFVQRAAGTHRHWKGPLDKAVARWLKGDEREMDRVGRLMARHINDKVDRIDTRRLRHSFVHRITKR